ncbi:MAG: hypothetical protein JW733_00485 [Coriobacteriia bacterium]|nr:hypothetical protein [Coriobacteriia bacterium]MBN2841040.1 hypothetical protein [Coriobacteriia bacterium]
MTPDDRPQPRFEPPPWETEAFERFRREQEKSQAAEEPAGTTPTVHRVPAVREAAVPDARVEAMLAELRVEEAPATRAGLTLIYSAVAFLGTMGFFIALAGLVLFARTQPTDGAATMLAALTSLVMLFTGAGCIAGAVMLYRKHHQ